MNRFLTLTSLTVVLFFTLIPLITAGKDLEIKAYVDRTELALGEYFQYTVEISGSIGSIPPPELPDLGEFYTLSGPNESSSYQWVNGAMSASKSFSYLLQPKDAGEFTIASATLKVKREVLQTNPIVIKVLASGGQNQSSGQSPQSKGVQPEKQTQVEGNPEEVFLRAEADKTTLMQNDGVTITYKLYFRINVNTYEIAKAPQATGFWTEEHQLPAQPVVGAEVVNGRRYQVAAIRKVTLFPTRTGKLTIDPLEIQVQVREKRRSRGNDPFGSIFDDPFFGNTMTVPRYVQSNELNLQVLGFPAEGKPADFSGAVGQFSMEAGLDKDSVETNEAITFTVKIKGKGNIRTAPNPTAVFPPDFEKYDPEVETSTDKRNGEVYGIKVCKYLLVPRFPGQQVIEPIKFSYYNPAKRKYETLQSPPFTVTVKKGKETMMPGGMSAAPGKIQLYGSDINYIKSRTKLRSAGAVFYAGGMYVSAYIVPLMALIGAGLLREYYMKLNPAKVRARNAFRNAKYGLEKAGKMKVSHSGEEYYRMVENSLRNYLADKLNIAAAGLALEEIEEEVLKQGIRQESWAKMAVIIQQCSMGRFSPGNISGSGRSKLTAEAKDVLNVIEGEWK